MKILISGGNGLLARELIKANPGHEVKACDHYELDVSDYAAVDGAIRLHTPDVFIHCAALTNPMVLHDEDPLRSINTNIIGTANVTMACQRHGVKLVYISTDYVYKGERGDYKEDDEVLPINRYAWSKLGGECAVRLLDNFLILRCSHCPRPFRHPKAFVDCTKSSIYTDEIAGLIWQLIDKDATGIYNVGGPTCTVYEFAKQENPDIGQITRAEIGDWVPKDISMNLEKLHDQLV